MVQFAKRLEDAKQQKWIASYCDYDRLKLLLKLLTGAAKRRDGAAVGALNFGGGACGELGDDSGFGLLEPTPTLDAGLAPDESDRLLRVLAHGSGEPRRRGPGLKRATSMHSGLGAFGGSSGALHLLAPDGSRGDEEATHWTRALFSAFAEDSYALLLSGFDVALVCELLKVEALHARELSLLEERWARSMQPETGCASYAAFRAALARERAGAVTTEE